MSLPIDSIKAVAAAGDVLNITFQEGMPDLLLQLSGAEAIAEAFNVHKQAALQVSSSLSITQMHCMSLRVVCRHTQNTCAYGNSAALVCWQPGRQQVAPAVTVACKHSHDLQQPFCVALIIGLVSLRRWAAHFRAEAYVDTTRTCALQ